MLILAVYELVAKGGSPPETRLTFLHDWNVAFTFVISMPLMAYYTASDQGLLHDALLQLIKDGVLRIGDDASKKFRTVWERRFRRGNLICQALGIGAGLGLACYIYAVYSQPVIGYWIIRHGRLSALGWCYLYCVAMFYALIGFYVFRSINIIRFLHALVLESEITLIPFHPDRCGGLRPVGTLGLRHQYMLTVFGVNVSLLAFFSFACLGQHPWLSRMVMAAAGAYVILGPFVFFGPLFPFRNGMLKTKTELMSTVSRRLLQELERVRHNAQSGTITKEDEELIDRLRKLGTLIDELPVWPFDARTVRKVIVAYVLPILGSICYLAVSGLIGIAIEWLRAALGP